MTTNFSMRQTIVPVGTTSTQVIEASDHRRFLAWMVVGSADVTITPGSSPAVVGQGIVYQASGANKQGASEQFVDVVPINSFQCIADSTGSSLIVWEGL